MSIEAEIARNYEKGALLSFDRNLSYENKEFLEKAIAPHPLSFENSFPIIRIEYHPAAASLEEEKRLPKEPLTIFTVRVGKKEIRLGSFYFANNLIKHR